MDNTPDDVFFTVVMPTRNRPELFKIALDSVMDQQFKRFEIVVVNDGSTGDDLAQYQAMESQYAGKATFHYLLHRPNGHGQSYSMNYGALNAQGQYLCFLDDDDNWTDPEHLERAYQSITHSPNPVDLYFTNQTAYFSDNRKQTDNVWIEDLAAQLHQQTTDQQGAWAVTTEVMLQSKGFAHLNCSIYRKGLYEQIQGMDENIRYECDRDVYLSALDAADTILHHPAYIARHNIPDKKKKDNMSTLVSEYEKNIFQLRVYDKGILLSKKTAVMKHCKTGKGYVVKRIADYAYQSGNKRLALYYAKEGLAIAFGVKWLSFTLYLFFASLMP